MNITMTTYIRYMHKCTIMNYVLHTYHLLIYLSIYVHVCQIIQSRIDLFICTLIHSFIYEILIISPQYLLVLSIVAVEHQ